MSGNITGRSAAACRAHRSACPNTRKSNGLALSIIVLTFNRWDRTEKLLQSFVDDDDDYRDVELVWVDNGSTDNTQAAFGSWLDRNSRIFSRVVSWRNEVNQGFILGANQGLVMASEDRLCLLNNDAVVTSRWRRRLMHLLSERNFAAVGPVSDGMPWNQSLKYAGRGVREVPVVYGFCLLTRRTAIHQVGLLDERYGRGVIEVEDWCERARRAGMRFAIDCETVVYHDEPHASYTPRINAMLHARNKQLFEAKWGVGPYYWGERTRALREFTRTQVAIYGDNAPEQEHLSADLAALDPNTERLIFRNHTNREHTGWIRLARRDPRLNVICVRPDWDRTLLDDLISANARSTSVEIDLDLR